IIDYHCHVPPQEIAEDKTFANITEAWLGGDHYKWRLMRSNGIDEKYITGDASPYEKFEKYAEALQRAIGNPLYHWTHLELQRYFDCDIPLTPATCKEIWELCNKKLQSGDMSVRQLIKRSNVTALCTTDDPMDTLKWHAKMRDDATWDVKVLPAFRPDKAVNIEKPGFVEYIAVLGKAAGMTIETIDDLQAALRSRIDFFDSMGCVASDHGLDYITWAEDCEAVAPAVFAKAMAGDTVSTCEMEAYKAAMMLFLGREYAARGWVMQLHYGTSRNTNTNMLGKLGPDTGFDCISQKDCSGELLRYLDGLEREGKLPKTILYSLDPTKDPFLASAIGAFQGAGIRGKIQHGSAWWFNDTKTGMVAQMTNLANMGVLGNFVGMLTDSRSFLSYTRHEYFRRILCNLIGSWVENGEYPADEAVTGALVEDISYNNTVNYFGF
ncbi:glucuronate isomerase, partial [Ruminococcaceae bacterium OttesenSCG-928-L11]|nr:glucuronate isomerase [Ruminococcaceae bacterium OttesenSCG-928-L11]